MLNDLKKLFFGAKSVAKSTGKKAVDAGKEASEELTEKSKEYFDKARDKAESLREEYEPKVREKINEARNFAEEMVEEAWKKGDELKDQAKERAEAYFSTDKEEYTSEQSDIYASSSLSEDDISAEFEDNSTKEDPPTPTEKSKVETLGEDIGKAAGAAGKKAQDFTEEVGKKVMEEGGKAWDKFQVLSEKVGKRLMDTSEEVGGKLKSRFDDLVERANQEAEKENIEDLTEEAQKIAEELEERIKERGSKSNFQNLQEDKAKGGTLGGFDSFFDKAARYADGDYHNEGEGHIKIDKDPDYKPEETAGMVKGFEDMDGDGNEIIDDAIIDDSDDDPKDA